MECTALVLVVLASSVCGKHLGAVDVNGEINVIEVPTTVTPLNVTMEINNQTVTDVPVSTMEANDTTTSIPVTETTLKPNSTTSQIPTSVPTTPASTPVPVTTRSPASSPATTVPSGTTSAPHKNRHFDGPSFIGGIILAVGLMAVGLVSFKFYKARTERNYHTL